MEQAKTDDNRAYDGASRESFIQYSLDRALRMVGEKDVNFSFAQDQIAQLKQQVQEKDKIILDLTAKFEKEKSDLSRQIEELKTQIISKENEIKNLTDHSGMKEASAAIPNQGEDACAASIDPE